MTTASIEVLQERVAELFMNVCTDPDNAEVAAEADRTLHELDEILAGVGSGETNA